MELKTCPFCGGKVVEYHAKSENPPIDLGYRFFVPIIAVCRFDFMKQKNWRQRIGMKGLKINKGA